MYKNIIFILATAGLCVVLTSLFLDVRHNQIFSNKKIIQPDIMGVNVSKKPDVTTKKNQEKKIDPGNFYAPILFYHHIAKRTPQDSYYVSPEIFKEQMAWLKNNGYNVISMDKFYEAAHNHGTLPKKPVVITFDDSLLDQYQNAFPVLKKYGYTATFFVKMNNIGDKSLSWKKLKEMSDAGMLIESHSVNHDNMAIMSTETLNYELQVSKKEIEDHLGTKVKYFCYPGGAYSNKTINATKAAGYLMAFTTKHRVMQSVTDENSLYTIPRVHIDDEMPTFIDWVQGKNLK